MENIEKALRLKEELDSLRPLSVEDETRIMQKFRLDWNYHSNHIEGNSLTYGETKALILFGITAQGKPLKDHFEISGHDEALKWILDIIKEERPITENFIRELHKLILKEPYEVDAITPDGKPTKKKIKIGEYKSVANHVKTKTGEIFRFANSEETPALMKDLIDWFREKIVAENVNPILVASEFHYRFIRIHPFDDGNGRTVRILMNFILMQFGYPPVIIKTEDKINYFGVLRQADSGLLQPFIDYISKNLVISLEIMVKGAKGESIEDLDDFDKEISLLENRLKSVSNPIEIFKNKKSILELYDNSIGILIQKFIDKAELFDKFYLKNKFYLFIDGNGYGFEKSEAYSNSRPYIKNNTNSISLQYSYIAFNHEGFNESHHNSNILIQFDLSKYKVSNSQKKRTIEKRYGEQLSSDEIKELINVEVSDHKSKIELQIEKLKKKQSGSNKS